MKGRIGLLVVLLLALFGILWVKSDRVQTPIGPVSTTDIPRADRRASLPPPAPPVVSQPPSEQSAEKPAARHKSAARKRVASQRSEETVVPVEASAATMPTEVTEPAHMQVEAPQASSEEFKIALPKADEEEPEAGLLPFPWIDQVQESQPGFVDPNRLDARDPHGDPILRRPAPTGPRAGFYDPENRFASGGAGPLP